MLGADDTGAAAGADVAAVLPGDVGGVVGTGVAVAVPVWTALAVYGLLHAKRARRRRALDDYPG